MDVHKAQNEDTKRGQDYSSLVLIFNFEQNQHMNLMFS